MPRGSDFSLLFFASLSFGFGFFASDALLLFNNREGAVDFGGKGRFEVFLVKFIKKAFDGVVIITANVRADGGAVRSGEKRIGEAFGLFDFVGLGF